MLASAALCWSLLVTRPTGDDGVAGDGGAKPSRVVGGGAKVSVLGCWLAAGAAILAY